MTFYPTLKKYGYVKRHPSIKLLESLKGLDEMFANVVERIDDVTKENDDDGTIDASFGDVEYALEILAKAAETLGAYVSPDQWDIGYGHRSDAEAVVGSVMNGWGISEVPRKSDL